MTKQELMKILDKVEDNARITINNSDGLIVDIRQATYGKAAPDWLKIDEVYLLVGG